MADNGIGIKVCGMREPDNIRQLVNLEPDFIGFILFPDSKRYVGDDFRLTTDIPPAIHRVGVFVNALMDEVIHWVNRLELNFVQLHGTESAEYCRELSGMKIPVIKAFGVDDAFDFSSLSAYSDCCEFFLFDSKSPLHGGSGLQFNRDLLNLYALNTPFFLGGGIGPEDISDIRLIKNRLPLAAVDINSRFEISPGIKNIELLRKFINAIRK